jgi:hypothetical protein
MARTVFTILPQLALLGLIVLVQNQESGVILDAIVRQRVLSIQNVNLEAAITKENKLRVDPIMSALEGDILQSNQKEGRGSHDMNRNSNHERSQEPRVAIYMTTHMSEQHRQFLLHCWPAAVQRLPLLRNADLLAYTSSSNKTDEALFYNLGFPNVTILHYQVYDYQEGAVVAMVDPFLPEHAHWFEPYDWIVRLNPDVLIRRDDWLRATMKDDSVDGIFVTVGKGRIGTKVHSDFYAFRPQAAQGERFLQRYEAMKEWKTLNAEKHLSIGFQGLIQSERVRFLPNVELRNKFLFRVEGKDSDVLHTHELVDSCPNYFEATDGQFY